MTLNEVSMLYVSMPIAVALLLACTLCLVKIQDYASDMRISLKTIANLISNTKSVSVVTRVPLEPDGKPPLTLLPGKKEQ